MADLDPRLNELVRYYYMIPRYRINQIAVRFDDCDGTKFNENSLDIQIFNVVHILKFLRNFGDLITEITFHNYNDLFSIEDSTEITRHIEKYCSKTLSQLSLIDPKSHLISKTQTIFKRVIRLQIWRYDNLDNFEINRIYPMVEHLYLNSPTDLNNFGSLAQTYRRLQHLEVVTAVPLKGGSAVQGLFKLNPQIRHLALRNCPDMDLLQFINDNLRQLERLEIAYSNQFNSNTSSRVHFKNVKEFTLFEYSFSSDREYGNPFSFHQLEAIEITSEYFSSSVQNLIEQNKKIRKLSLARLVIDDLRRAVIAINNTLPDLEELVIKWIVEIGLADMLRQIEDKQSKLKKITLVVSMGADSDAILAVITDNWELINVSTDQHNFNKHFTIVRREDRV